ncbi:RrF2 family transcriptional regulator [Desulfosoma caldarium]|uniref:BadM/Rrf2 family transcriptional regulator n=1 Tax=Desulfosoma caldarium TaxID=610254 RepID=A0A3N1UU99_9BACT|nr:Rrf2 family transcriptional regulator [Desulfosoma caldarium]ROQ92300.1 BadM/Rrf2 family transcriptional regulator [Desulfosoma caldarium]
MVSLSTRSRYGTRLMMSLARHSTETPVQIADVALDQGISVKYLEQIALVLRKAGLIKTVRGRKGGHMLAKDPENITLEDIVAALEGGRHLAACVSNPHLCPRASRCGPRRVWQELSETLFEKLRLWTLRDVVRLEETLMNREDSSSHRDAAIFCLDSSRGLLSDRTRTACGRKDRDALRQ